MKLTLFTALFISLIVKPFGHPVQPGYAKDNLQLYTRDDGMAGHSFINWHALNKSALHRITFTAFFKTDGSHPIYWKQTMTLDRSEDRNIGAARYPGSTNSTFCTADDVHYALDY